MKCIKLLGALLSAGIIANVSGAEWPEYRGADGDGKAKETLTAWAGNAPKKVWQIDAPKGFSSFSVANGRAFTQVIREMEGAPQEVCIGVDAQSGKELWAQPVGMPNYGHDGGNAGARGNTGGDGPRSTPTIDGDRVYVLSSDLVLTCFNAANGQKVWTKNIMREHDGQNITWKNAASPVLDGDLIYVAGGGKGQALLAFNKKDGEVAWKGEDDKMTHATPAVATIHGVRQVIFFTQKGLVAMEAKTGKPLWRYDFKFNVSTAASPVVAEDHVYCSAGYGVGAGLVKISKSGDSFKADEVWRKNNELMNHWSTPVYKDGHLYGMFSFKEYGDGPIKCVELKTGREVWSKPGFGAGNVILAGNTLVALGDAGQLVLIEANPGEYKEIARADVIEGKCWSTPALADGKLYLRSTTHGAAFDMNTRVAQAR